MNDDLSNKNLEAQILNIAAHTRLINAQALEIEIRNANGAKNGR